MRSSVRGSHAISDGTLDVLRCVGLLVCGLGSLAVPATRTVLGDCWQVCFFKCRLKSVTFEHSQLGSAIGEETV